MCNIRVESARVWGSKQNLRYPYNVFKDSSFFEEREFLTSAGQSSLSALSRMFLSPIRNLFKLGPRQAAVL